MSTKSGHMLSIMLHYAISLHIYWQLIISGVSAGTGPVSTHLRAYRLYPSQSNLDTTSLLDFFFYMQFLLAAILCSAGREGSPPPTLTTPILSAEHNRAAGGIPSSTLTVDGEIKWFSFLPPLEKKIKLSMGCLTSEGGWIRKPLLAWIWIGNGICPLLSITN